MSIRSLLTVVIWFGLAIAVTEIASQLLSISQAGKTAPRVPSLAPPESPNTTLASSRSGGAALLPDMERRR